MSTSLDLRYGSLWALFEDVQKHVKMGHEVLESYDDPREERLGFKTATRSWSISLTTLKTTTAAYSGRVVTRSEYASIVLEYMKTREGREKLAESLTNFGKKYAEKRQGSGGPDQESAPPKRAVRRGPLGDGQLPKVPGRNRPRGERPELRWLQSGRESTYQRASDSGLDSGLLARVEAEK